MSDLHYDASARGHLKRARECLLNSDPTYLFYAALNLRFCVEERQDEYVQAQKRYMKSVPRAHKIGNQAAALKRVFNRDKIGQYAYEFGDAKPVTLYFTPVTKKLQSEAEKLGDILHVRKSAPTQQDPWWSETREKLKSIYRMAWTACQGEMLCPLILDKNGGVAGTISVSENVDPSFYEAMSRIGQKGILEVDYVDDLPGVTPDL